VKARYTDEGVESVPQTFKEAVTGVNYSKYKEAIISELRSQFDRNVFEMKFVTKLPPGADAIDSKWVFDIKNVTTGGKKRYKARFCVRGFMQKYMQSYNKTYSPTTQKDSLRELLALSAMYQLKTIHIDVKTAFLYGDLKEDEVLYNEIPDGFTFCDVYKDYCTPEDAEFLEGALKRGEKVYIRMKKSCYGTKQAARNWYEKLNQILNSMGFEASELDPCMYIKRDGNDFMIIVCYVDDIMGTGTNEKMFGDLIAGLKKELEIVTLGEITGCLGMIVTRDSDGSILLNNEIYIDNMLETFDMTDCNFADTPEAAGVILSKKDCIPREKYDSEVQERFRSLVGSLLYAAICWRPDILHSVAQVARFTGVAGVPHVHAANRILRYLKKTKNHGLLFKGGRSGRKIQPIFITCCDASYAPDEDRLSVSGWIRQMVDRSDWDSRKKDPNNLDVLPLFNCTSFGSRRQKGVVALSSTEAEYIAGADTVRIMEHSEMK